MLYLWTASLFFGCIVGWVGVFFMGHFFVRCFNIVSHFVVSYNNFLSLYLVCMYTRCISLVRYTREKKYRSGSRFCFISKSLLMLQLTIEPDRFNGQQIIPYLHQLWDVLRHYGSGPSHHPRIRQIIMTFNAQHVLMNSRALFFIT